MKKYIILLAAIVFTATASFVPADREAGSIIVKIEKGDVPKTINLRLANLQNMRTGISIQSDDGTFSHSNYVWGKTGYAAQFDLKLAPDGDYILFLKNRKCMWVQGFTLKGDDIVLFQRPRPARNGSFSEFVSYSEGTEGKLITHFTQKGDMSLDMQLANLQKQPTSINITALGAGIVFSQTVDKEVGFAESLNLEGFANGYYLLNVKAGDATVMQFFSISTKKLALGETQRLERPMGKIPVSKKSIASN